MSSLTARRLTRGWFKEPNRHRLAALGVKTKKYSAVKVSKVGDDFIEKPRREMNREEREVREASRLPDLGIEGSVDVKVSGSGTDRFVKEGKKLERIPVGPDRIEPIEFSEEGLPESIVGRDIKGIKKVASKVGRGTLPREDIMTLGRSVKGRGIFGTVAFPFKRAGSVISSTTRKVGENVKDIGHEANILRTEGLVATKRLATGIPEDSDTFIPSRKEAEGLIAGRVKERESQADIDKLKADAEKKALDAQRVIQDKIDDVLRSKVNAFTRNPKNQRKKIIEILEADKVARLVSERIPLKSRLSADERRREKELDMEKKRNLISDELKSTFVSQLSDLNRERVRGVERALKAPIMSLAKKKRRLKGAKTDFFVTPNYIRERHQDPKKFKRGSFRTVDPGKKGGTLIVVGKLKGNEKTSLQSILHENNQRNRNRFIEDGVAIK